MKKFKKYQEFIPIKKNSPFPLLNTEWENGMWFSRIHFLVQSTKINGVMAIVLNSDLKVSKFEPESNYCVHFQNNTLGKGMNHIIPQL